MAERRRRLLGLLLVVFGCGAGGVGATETLHLLVPGGAGGGWDTTARATGHALMAAGLVAHLRLQARKLSPKVFKGVKSN